MNDELKGKIYLIMSYELKASKSPCFLAPKAALGFYAFDSWILLNYAEDRKKFK